MSCGRNPVEEYEDTVIKTYKNVKKSSIEINLKQLRDSLKAFHEINGRYPKDLKELSDFSGIKLEEDRYDYDPGNGTINSKY
ncbi:MAG: hypothetical protein AB1638_01835 [Nitrospirota bacterium]